MIKSIYNKKYINYERTLYYPKKNNKINKISICNNIICNNIICNNIICNNESQIDKTFDNFVDFNFPPIIDWEHIELIFLNGDTFYIPIINSNYGLNNINNYIINYLITNIGYKDRDEFDYEFGGYNKNNPIYYICDKRHIDKCCLCDRRYHNILDNIKGDNYNYFKNFPKIEFYVKVISHYRNRNRIKYLLSCHNNYILLKLSKIINKNLKLIYPLYDIFTMSDIIKDRDIKYCGFCLIMMIKKHIS